MNRNLKKILLSLSAFGLLFAFTAVRVPHPIVADYCAGQLKCAKCDPGSGSCGGGWNLDMCGSTASTCGGENHCRCGSGDCTTSNTCEWKITATPTPTPQPTYNPPPPPPPGSTPQPPPPGNPPEQPPGSPERCYHCVGYQCRGYDVDPGQCFTNCGDDNCGEKPEDPSNQIENCVKCENYQCVNYDVPKGTCSTSCDANTCKPPFNYVKSCTVSVSSPSITTTGQIDINASAVSNAPSVEIEPARLVLAKSDYSKITTPISGALEYFSADNGRYFYIFQTDPILLNGSFENGKNYWSISQAVRADWGIVSNLVWPVPTPPPPVPTHGNYYLGAGRNWIDDSASADAHIVSDWIKTSGDLTGQTFRLTFKAKGHNNPKTIKGISIQRYPKVTGSTLDWSNTIAGFGDINITPSGWTEFSRDMTFSYPTNANNSTLMRVVLRVSSFNDGYEAVYYDHIRLSRAVNNTFNCNTSSNNLCQDSVTLKGIDAPEGELAQGNYVTFCDMPTNAPDGRLFMCSGNPNCIFNGGNVATDANCSTWWKDCKDDVNNPNDHTTFSVIQNCSAPYCGVGGCPATDAGTPPTITSMWAQPADGISHTLSTAPSGVNTIEMMSTSNRTINISWDTPTTDTKTDEYELYVWNSGWKGTLNDVIATTGLPAWGTCTSGQNVCRYKISRNPTSPTHSRSHTLIANTSHPPHLLKFGVRAVNTDCIAYGQPFYRSVELVADIGGNFYESNLGVCSGMTQAVPELSSFQIQSTTGGSTYTQSKTLPITSSSYTFDNIPYIPTSAFGDSRITATLNPTPSDPANTYVCSSCNVGGSDNVCVLNNLYSPSQNKFIYLDKYNLSNGPWWQVANGLIYSGGMMTSEVPDTCGTSEPLCKRAIGLRQLTGTINARSAAPPLTGAGAGSINSGSGKKSDRSAPDPTDTWSTGVDFSKINITKEDYLHFASKVNLSDPKVTTLGSSTDNLNASMFYDDTDNTKILSRTGNLTINPPTAGINIGAGQKVIVFVNGNLTINDTGTTNRKLFNVHSTAYLAFIVSGSITFSRDIGYTIGESNYTSYAFEPNVTGVFVANRIIIAGDASSTTPEKKFVGEGTFVAWGNGTAFEFNRDFNDGSIGRRFHNGGPTELFRYRPSYLEYTPKIMEVPGLLWQEVN